ncbi:DJ-1/PfpI family protein [Candidatus Woesearchaeota archaeon]|nr:DJ-1/PfpI family protein [Candidatus Woesearchaeota archaeon]
MKALFIIAPKEFRDEEYFEPKEILEKAGIEVETASTTTKECIGKLGGKVTPDLTLSEVVEIDYDIIIVVGGPGAPALGGLPEFNTIIKTADSNEQKIAAICIAPMLLAYAGILAGKKATVFSTPESLKALKHGGATYVKEDVVVDGRIITANGPSAAKKFGEAIVKLLKGK